MSVEQIEANVASIRATLQSLLGAVHEQDQGPPATFLNNLVRQAILQGTRSCS